MKRDPWYIGLEVLASTIGAVVTLAIWYAVLRIIGAVSLWWAP